MRRTLVVLAALAPLTAMAEVTFYAGAGAAGLRLEEKINASVTVNDLTVDTNNPTITYAFPCSAGFNPKYPTTPIPSCSKADGPFDFSGTDMGMRVFGGVRFLTYFGVEAGYVTLGQPQDELPYAIPPGKIGCNPAISFNCERSIEVDSTVVMTDSIHGWELYALGGYPVTDKLEVFGKVGVYAWDSSFKVVDANSATFPPDLPYIPNITVTPNGTIKTSGTDPAYGIGVNYKISDHMILRGEGTWYDIQNVDRLWTIGFNVIVTL